MKIWEEDVLAVLRNIRSELAIIKQVNVEMCKYMREAEAEIPESYRRFLNAFHDLHDIKYMNEEIREHICGELEHLLYKHLMSKSLSEFIKDMYSKGYNGAL